MSLWHAAASAGPWVGTAVGGYAVAALVNRPAANKEAEASDKQADTADWKGFTDSVLKRLGDVEGRLDTAEAAASKYLIAVAYIRQIAEWVGQQLPGRRMPPPPPELEPDL